MHEVTCLREMWLNIGKILRVSTFMNYNYVFMTTLVEMRLQYEQTFMNVDEFEKYFNNK